MALDINIEYTPDPWVKRMVEYLRSWKKREREYQDRVKFGEDFFASKDTKNDEVTPQRKFRMVKSEGGIHAEMMVSHYSGTSEVEICLDGKLVATIHHGGIELCTNIDPALGIWTDDSGMMRVHKGVESRQMVTPAKVKNEF